MVKAKVSVVELIDQQILDLNREIKKLKEARAILIAEEPATEGLALAEEGKTRRISMAARKRIGEAQARRWKEFRARRAAGEPVKLLWRSKIGRCLRRLRLAYNETQTVFGARFGCNSAARVSHYEHDKALPSREELIALADLARSKNLLETEEALLAVVKGGGGAPAAAAGA